MGCVTRNIQRTGILASAATVGLLSLALRTEAYMKSSYRPRLMSHTSSSSSTTCHVCSVIRSTPRHFYQHSSRHHPSMPFFSSRATQLFSSSSSLPPRPDPPPTISSYRAWATKLFLDQGIPDAEASADYLLIHALGWSSSTPRSSLTSKAHVIIEPAALDSFLSLCQRRCQREPVQYLIGSWDFHRISLEVRPPILIPRPETEELVEWVLEEVGAWKKEKRDKAIISPPRSLRFLDIGCGSGAIGLALLNVLPEAVCIGIDPNPIAVDLSTRNAKKLGLSNRYSAIQSSIVDYDDEDKNKFDFIVSNPPYIPKADMAGLQEEVKMWEDENALVGGDDGADIIRQILDRSPSLLSSNGLRKVWMEVDVSHPPAFAAKRLVSPSIGMRLMEWRRDLSDRPRFCCWGM